MKSVNNLYLADVEIDVKNQFLKSHVKLTYHATKDDMTVLVFYLYKDLQVESVNCENIHIYNVGSEIADWCPFVLESKKLEIYLSKPLMKGETVEIEFKYSGIIKTVSKWEVNRISEEWVELGIYTPWFPLAEEFEQALFEVKLMVDPEYTVLSGLTTIKIDDYWLIKQDLTNFDCTFIASKDFKVASVESDYPGIPVYFIESKQKELAEEFSKESSWIMNYYHTRFGEIANSQQSLVIIPRELGGGYCRPGLIVMTPGESEMSLYFFGYLAHEIAHLWWSKSKNCNSWEDWLNESFAEYSSLLAIREKYGEEKFSELIQKYQEKVKGLPPIRGIDRGSEEAHSVLYNKGPILLFKLESKIGRSIFENLLKEIHLREINSTAGFLNTLFEMTNQTVVDYFGELLAI